MKALPVVVIGAGPVGLAAANLVAMGEKPPVLEAGVSVAASVLAWGLRPASAGVSGACCDPEAGCCS